MKEREYKVFGNNSEKLIPEPELLLKEPLHVPMPDYSAISEIADLVRSIIFPQYFDFPRNRKYRNAWNEEKKKNELHKILHEQIFRTLSFQGPTEEASRLSVMSLNTSRQMIDFLPDLHRMLLLDVTSAYEGDPAATSISEVIYAYPMTRTLINYRFAHELLKLGIPLIPRILTELAHSETGIDIHPGASIGESFSIDHGTGVVIGETSIIGNNVKLFQSVTLGAKKFSLDEKGKPVKGIPRHPIIEENVTIYANTTILGRIRIGKNSIIGGNLWITSDVPADSRMVQRKPLRWSFIDGEGI